MRRKLCILLSVILVFVNLRFPVFASEHPLYDTGINDIMSESSVNDSDTDESSNKSDVFEGNGYKVYFVVTDSWNEGYNALIKIENTSATHIDNWSLSFVYDSEISNFWNATLCSHEENNYIVKNVGWNQDIAPGQIVEFGISGQEAYESFPISYDLMGGIEKNDEKDYEFSYEVVSEWNDGFTASVAITNTGEVLIEDWIVEFDYSREITKIWNAEVLSHEGNHYIIKNAGHNANIPTNTTISIGFNGNGGDTSDKPYNIVISSFRGNDVISEETEIPDIDEEEVDLTDSDDDGLPDFYEELIGTDKNDIDSDHDGLPDGYEIFTNYTYPNKDDTDGNGITDDEEDPDEDGLSNIEEFRLVIDPIDPDTDGDGMFDAAELQYEMNPNDQDTLDDGIMDGDRVFNVWKECDPSDNGIIKPSISLDLEGKQIDSFVTRKLENNDPFLNERIPGYIGNGYEFYVDGEIENALLEIEIDSEILTNSEIDPVLYYWNEEIQLFEEVEDQQKTDNSISASLQHFSQYIVLDRNKYNELAFRFSIESPNVDKNLKKNRDIVVALDESGSIETREFDYMKDQCAAMIDTLDENDRVSIFVFSNIIRKVTSFIPPVFAADSLRKLKMGYGYTAIYETIKYAIEEFEKYSTDDVSKSIIVLTDGGDTSSTITVPEIIKKANDNDISLYMVGVGQVDSEAMAQLSESTGGEYYHISNFYQINEVFDLMTTEADLYKDTDGDGISDYHEKKIASGQLFTGSGEALNLCESMDFRSNDSDGDGLLDGEEVTIKKLPNTENYYCYMSSNPCMIDTDQDSYDDYVEEYIGVSPVNIINRIDETKSASFNLPGFKLNTWDDWQELIKSHAWNYIHNAVQDDIVFKNQGITKEHPIPGVGRCDLIRLESSHIWEVKPASYILPGKMKKAESQLASYVKGYCGFPGDLSIPNDNFQEGKYMVRYFNMGNGIILYSYSKRKSGPEKAVVRAREKVKDKGYRYSPHLAPQNPLQFWGGVLGITIIGGTLIEDVFTGGIGVTDDAACFLLAYELMNI